MSSAAGAARSDAGDGGLIMASAALLIRGTSAEWGTAGITVVAALLFLFTRIHPLLVLAAAAAVGASDILS